MCQTTHNPLPPDLSSTNHPICERLPFKGRGGGSIGTVELEKIPSKNNYVIEQQSSVSGSNNSNLDKNDFNFSWTFPLVWILIITIGFNFFKKKKKFKTEMSFTSKKIQVTRNIIFNI